MNVRVLLFASWADAIGARSVEVELAEEATVADVLAALSHRAGTARLPRPALAVNRELAGPADPVRRGDEVALIPPVAGG